MAKSLDDIDRTRIQPTRADACQVQACRVLDEPDMTFLRARRMANRIEEPEQVIRYYRAALAGGEDASASAFLYRLCRLLNESPDVLVREFGGAFLLEGWVEEEKYMVGMITERTPCGNPFQGGRETGRKSRWDSLRRGRVDKKVSLEEVIGILEDLALHYAEKAYAENPAGNPRGMRQHLWKSKGIVEAAERLRRMLCS
jgi:hypothetical protein